MDEITHRFTIGIIAEVHLAGSDAPVTRWHNDLKPAESSRLLDQAMALIAKEPVDALALLGDLTNEVGTPLLSEAVSQAGGRGVPVYVVPGNHDIDYRPDASDRFAAHATSGFTTLAPARFALAGGLDVTLVSLQRDPDDGGLHTAGFDSGRFHNANLRIVLSHYPALDLRAVLDSAGLKHAGDLKDRAAFERALTDPNTPALVVHGHLHVRATSTSGQVLQLSCAALVEPPHEITIVSIEVCQSGIVRVQRRTRNVEAYAVENLPVLAPEDETWTWLDGRWLAI